MSLYIFGPIHSRRFGTSLGIDLSPTHKRCNFDCLYCELAPMAPMKESDADFVVADVINELEIALKQHPQVDVITLTANGEPTMYKAFDALTDAIKSLHHDAKLLVLSNAALIHEPALQKSLKKIECVKLSLDAVSKDIFEKVDRPHKSIDIEVIKAGILEFSKTYTGELVIEILFVSGMNDTKEEIALLNNYLINLKPFRIDIGTVDRPPAYGVSAVSNERLDSIATMFDPTLNVFVAHRKTQESVQSAYSNEEIVSTLDKRPLSPEDVQALFDFGSQDRLNQLIADKEVVVVEQDDEQFYILQKNLHKKRKKS